ncbi:MAG: glycosyltransferase [Paraglaciecola sp.]|uniref:glycosyltransferase n=1 Tax=Paraglaciecola sp. TaxID=1920173 RepID=UPI00273E970E|nr:glycosyltransferase [Paraglaciecola sp.]MDP5031416.1 glycosyltransferase [Paraglaciecola sp.]MDP5129238.1 glycosyltransferase [Paraglaciecola sp.]
MTEEIKRNKTTINVLQFICPTGFYGAERWILALAKHLDPSKVKCDLVVTAEAANPDLELCKEYKKLGLDSYEIPMSSKFDLTAVAKLVELIKDKNIHIIHTHGYKSDIIGVLAAKKAGIHCVVTPHGFENAKDLKLRTFIWLGCQAMRFATKVVPLSKQLMRDCKRIGVKDSKVLYIQNGVDLSEVEAFPAPQKSESREKRIGFVGQMISRKNISDLLDIFDSLHDKHPNTRLILLGDGDQRVELESYAKQLPSTTHIEFLGFRDDRLALLKSFDLFVMTSTLEGIPRCLMEATAAEIPVAAYNIAGIDQLITHNQSGLLAPLGDKALLEQYWESLLFDDVLAKKLTAEAKRFVYDNYSAKRMANEYTDLFEQLTRTVQ